MGKGENGNRESEETDSFTSALCLVGICLILGQLLVHWDSFSALRKLPNVAKISLLELD